MKFYLNITKVRFTAVISLCFLLGANAQGTIFSGTGFGTYYYDVEHVVACNTSFLAQNSGNLECSSETALSLDQVNSNYVVAMNHSQLVSDMTKFCGKRIIVTINGRQSDLPLFVGDGCQRCAGRSSFDTIWDPVEAPGLDFSYSALKELYGDAACTDGHVPISWEIVDDTIYDFSDGANPLAPGIAHSMSLTESTISNSFSETSKVLDVNGAIQSTSLNPSAIEKSMTATSRGICGPCPTGTWQCNGNILEQCLTDTWTPRITCGAGMMCQGDTEPYCVETSTFV